MIKKLTQQRGIVYTLIIKKLSQQRGIVYTLMIKKLTRQQGTELRYSWELTLQQIS